MMENFPVRARTEVRTGWTAQNLYFLFVCPYEQLNLRPNPKTSTETYGLWNWDVAEVFIGADFKDVKRYEEFEISPQGEWTDLDATSLTRGASCPTRTLRTSVPTF